jgi:hypothetical protein
MRSAFIVSIVLGLAQTIPSTAHAHVRPSDDPSLVRQYGEGHCTGVARGRGSLAGIARRGRAQPPPRRLQYGVH